MKHIAILGFGVVGGGVYEVLRDHAEVNIKYILDLRKFPGHPLEDRVTTDLDKILADNEVAVVVETMGGIEIAYKFSKAALLAGKSVVTSNKAVVDAHGKELEEIAYAQGVSYLYEASVGGGIPIIRPLRDCFTADKILKISGILNGTTNYILTRMDTEGASFDDVLKDAQRLGYAEANPAADVEGLDAARKTVILAAMAFGKRIDPNTILCEGITKITSADSELAKEMGYAIKLIGYTSLVDGKIMAMVSPRLVSRYNPLHGINGVFNGILVNADMVGEVMFYGPGAGKLPTASAVAGDMLDIMSHTPAGVLSPVWVDATPDEIADPETYVCRHLVVLDAPLAAESEIAAHFALNAVHFTEGRFSFITDELSEADVKAKIAAVGFPLVTRIRVL